MIEVDILSGMQYRESSLPYLSCCSDGMPSASEAKHLKPQDSYETTRNETLRGVYPANGGTQGDKTFWSKILCEVASWTEKLETRY